MQDLLTSVSIPISHPKGRRDERSGHRAWPRRKGCSAVNRADIVPGSAYALLPWREGVSDLQEVTAIRVDGADLVYEGQYRRHAKSKNRAKVAAKVRELERQRDEGNVTKPGRAWSVAKWLEQSLENIAKPSVRYKTYVRYRTAVRKHLITSVRAHPLCRLQP